MSDVGELLAHRYRLERRLGSGAMGVVWLATDERLLRSVAVKQLVSQQGLDAARVDEARQRAMREGRIAGRLHHPNVVAVHDVTEHSGLPVLVMEYMPSRSLADILAERGSLVLETAANIGVQAATALAAAHEAGIIHRDVKPGNVLLGEDGTVKITDFGISHAAGDIAVTQTGLLNGTPAFLAPEIARGHRPTAASDVFSLGATLYVAVEGRPPFGAHSENSLAILHEAAAGDVPPPQHAGALAPVLGHMMHSNPAERLTPQEVQEALYAVAAGHPVTTTIYRTFTEARTQPMAADSAATTATPHLGGGNGTRVDGQPIEQWHGDTTVPTGSRPRDAATNRRNRKLLYLVAAVAAAILAALFLTPQQRNPGVPQHTETTAPPPPPPPPAATEHTGDKQEGKGEEDKKGEQDKKGENN